MICTSCNQEFDEKHNIPRLLIVCGHSLCESCCYRSFVNNRVECPDCGSSTFTDSIALLPKNLALLPRALPHPPADLCRRHSKKYEGILPLMQPSAKNRTSSSAYNAYFRTGTRTTIWTASQT